MVAEYLKGLQGKGIADAQEIYQALQQKAEQYK